MMLFPKHEPEIVRAFLLIALIVSLPFVLNQIARAQDNVPYHFTIGYDNEDKTDASSQACLSHVESVTAWDKVATEKGAMEVCAARKRHIEAYKMLQTDYRALIEAFSTDRRLKIREAVSNLRIMIKACMTHKFSLTTGGHNIMMDIIENDIAADCLGLGSSLLKTEIARYNALDKSVPSKAGSESFIGNWYIEKS
jgi:hypothetical protein